MSTHAFVILIVCFASIALADDFKTIKGKEYKDVTVSRVEPDGIVLKTKSGISKIYFTELPKEIQQRFHYDAARAVQFTAATQAADAQARATAAAQQKAAQLDAAAAKIVAELDRLRLYVREGKISQVRDDGIVLRGPAWHPDGWPAQWIGPIFVSGSFPGAVDGAEWEGWIWPAGTYRAGTSTVEHWATSRDVALDAQLREAAATLSK